MNSWVTTSEMPLGVFSERDEPIGRPSGPVSLGIREPFADHFENERVKLSIRIRKLKQKPDEREGNPLLKSTEPRQQFFLEPVVISIEPSQSQWGILHCWTLA